MEDCVNSFYLIHNGQKKIMENKVSLFIYPSVPLSTYTGHVLLKF